MTFDDRLHASWLRLPLPGCVDGQMRVGDHRAMNAAMTWRNLCACVLVACVAGLAAPAGAEPVAWWRFEGDEAGQALDSAGNVADVVSGLGTQVSGVDGAAMRFDGLTTCVTRAAAAAPRLGGAFTIEAWVAIQAYPWAPSAIVSQCAMPDAAVSGSGDPAVTNPDPTAGYFFGIDATGHVRLGATVDGAWRVSTSAEAIPLMTWTHVAGTFDAAKGLAVYVNGVQQGASEPGGTLTFAPDVDLQIGRNHKARAPQYPVRLSIPAEFSLDGFLDEVRVHDRALPIAEIAASHAAISALPAAGMTARRLPSEPHGPAPFGAYYTHLRFADTWDAHRREGDQADVVVLFDGMPWRYVFWRGTGYVPHWVTENGIWYTNEFNETWGNGALGCAEPMSDKQTRHSHVRVIEQSDARVVVHWRYALIDTRYVFARVDPLTGWGDWTDEYHVIYPDGVGVRRIVLWSTDPLGAHEWQESIVLNQPGTRPEDNLETAALTMLNMDGASHTYSWADGPPEKIALPPQANIEVINTKSRAKPFVIVSDKPFRYLGDPVMLMLRSTLSDEELEALWAEYNSLSPEARQQKELELYMQAVAMGLDKGMAFPGPHFAAYTGEIIRERSIFPWWNHWPVAQIPSDGRWAMAADRVGHSSVTTGLEWEDHEVTPNRRTRIMLHGLTEEPATELVPLARSWLRAPALTLAGGDYTTDGYDRAERAYVLSHTAGSAGGPIRLQLAASAESPAVNPALIIRGWGDVGATLELEGASVPRGPAFRYGHRRTPGGTDLIVWLKVQAEQPLAMTLAPAVP